MDKDFRTITETLLQRIDGPEDIRDLTYEELDELAGEIRELIIHTVARNGGHLASSLGVVELTIALLKVFQPPSDRIVWDVGHQAYAYKILTGRREAFPSLRTLGGLSGFPKRNESPYDFFDMGHAGNAISAAAGMAQARCSGRRDHKVVAVVGDGSLTCGVSYEGLNQAGAAKKGLIIVLNDNEMSISPNVGAMAAYLNRIMTGQVVTRFRSEIKNLLANIPGVMGRSLYLLAKQFEDALKGFITPGRLFEDLGFNYVGPIDGHRIKHLVETFQNVSRLPGPVLVHTVTCKGKGYCWAEEDPSHYHGIGPFEVSTGEIAKSSGVQSFTSVFGDTMIRLAERNPQVMAVTAAMEYGTGLAEFGRIYPRRFFDVGIAEQHGVVFAAGLASEGYRPVVAIYSTFIQRAYDHIIHDVCMQGLPVVFAMDRAGIVGEDGPTHHGVFDIAFTRHIPDFTIMAPATGRDLADMLHTALALDGPCAIRYPRADIPESRLADEEFELAPIGKAKMLQQGRDLMIVALGSMVGPGLEAAATLRQSGVSVGVMDARFVKPLDRDGILEAVSQADHVIVVEEGIVNGGFGSAVTELVTSEGIAGCRISCMGIPDSFVHHGRRHELLDQLGLNGEGIVRRACEMLDINQASQLRCIGSSTQGSFR